MADEKNTEKDPEKGTDLEGTTPSEQDATAPDVGENAEAENPKPNKLAPNSGKLRKHYRLQNLPLCL